MGLGTNIVQFGSALYVIGGSLSLLSTFVLPPDPYLDSIALMVCPLLALPLAVVFVQRLCSAKRL